MLERRCNMNIKDPITEKSELVMEALRYAHDHNLDIKSKEDVKKVLQVLNSEPIGEVDVDQFMVMLQSAKDLIQKDVNRRNHIN